VRGGGGGGGRRGREFFGFATLEGGAAGNPFDGANVPGASQAAARAESESGAPRNPGVAAAIPAAAVKLSQT